MKHLQGDLTDISGQGISPQTKTTITRCLAEAEETLDLLKLVRKKLVFGPDGKFVTTNLDARRELLELLIASLPDDEDDPPQPGFLKRTIVALEDILQQTDAPLNPARPDLTKHQGTLQNLFNSLTKRFNNFQSSGLSEARAKAVKFLEDTQSQIETLGRELNAFFIGPIFMFDAARLRAGGVEEKFRYGVGSGLQIEFFGLALRAGYSFNPERRPGESRGAFTFSFEVLDVLR